MLSSRAATRVLIWGSAVLTLALVAALWLDWPFGVRGTVWLWARRGVDFMPMRVALLVSLLAAWWAVTLWVTRLRGEWHRWQTALLLGGILLFTPLLQLVVEAQQLEAPLVGSFMEATATTSGFFHEGVRISNPNDFIRAHPAQMPSYRGVHLQTQPPGWPVTFWATAQLFEQVPAVADALGHRLLRNDCASPEVNLYSSAQIASSSLHIATLYLSGLGAVFLYLLGRALFSAETARLAALLFPLWPGLLVFKSIVDTLYALIALAALLLAWHALRKRSNRALLGLCVLLVGTTWLSFGVGATVILVALFLFIQTALWERTRSGLQRLTLIYAALGTSFLAFWLAVYFIWGISWLEMFQTSIDVHHNVRASAPLWGIYNYYELALFAGVPIVLAALWGALYAARRIARRQPIAGDGWLLTWLIFMIVFNAMGQVQAETGRIWLFVMPPAILSAAALWSQRRESNELTQVNLRVVSLLFVAQALSVALLLGTHASVPRTPAITRTLASNTSFTPAAFALGDAVGLEGYAIEEAGDAVAVTLFWRAEERVSAELNAFVHLLNANGDILSQHDGAPANGLLPTSCWLRGEIVTDTHLMPAADAATAIRIGLYDWRSGARMPVRPPVQDDAIVLPWQQ